MMVPISWYLGLASLLFCLGVIGVLVRRSAIVMFMGIELMLNAVNLTLVAYASRHGSTDGQVFVFFVLTVAAAEAAVGLAIILALFRKRRSTNVDDASVMKW